MSLKYIDAAFFIGRTFRKLIATEDKIEMETDDGKRYQMQHHQDCCERVSIHDITGSLTSILGSPILEATQDSSNDWPKDVEKPGYDPESFTWTTYVFTTKENLVKIRWLGQSNGYYGEGVDIDEVE